MTIGNTGPIICLLGYLIAMEEIFNCTSISLTHRKAKALTAKAKDFS